MFGGLVLRMKCFFSGVIKPIAFFICELTGGGWRKSTTSHNISYVYSSCQKKLIKSMLFLIPYLINVFLYFPAPFNPQNK